MIVQGSVIPKNVDLKETKKGLTRVLLNRNIIEKEVEIENRNAYDVVYEYEQVEIKVIKRDNLKTYIESNFDTFFSIGLNNEKRPDKPSIEKRLEAMEEALVQSLGV